MRHQNRGLRAEATAVSSAAIHSARTGSSQFGGSNRTKDRSDSHSVCQCVGPEL